MNVHDPAFFVKKEIRRYADDTALEFGEPGKVPMKKCREDRSPGGQGKHRLPGKLCLVGFVKHFLAIGDHMETRQFLKDRKDLLLVVMQEDDSFNAGRKQFLLALDVFIDFVLSYRAATESVKFDQYFLSLERMQVNFFSVNGFGIYRRSNLIQR